MSKKEYGVNTITPADSVQVPVMDGSTPGNLTMLSMYGYVNNKMKANIGYKLNLELNTTTYVITPKLYDIEGNLISTGDSVDLPMESVVVNGSYDSTNKKIVLTLKNGNTIDIPVSDLISGLVTTTTFNNALALKADASDLTAHTGNTNNPHSVTKAQVGLGNVNNTSDADKPISTATQNALNLKADSSTVSSHINDTSVHLTTDEKKLVSTFVVKNGMLYVRYQ